MSRASMTRERGAPVEVQALAERVASATRAEIESEPRVVWFGSRVEGNAVSRSDLDLAVDAGRALTPAERSRIEARIDELATLRQIDVIDLHCAGGGFRRRIRDLVASLDRAVSRLGTALRAPSSDLNRDASIQRFEFCFELAWKAIQMTLRPLGIDRASPKACLRAAYRQGWIAEEPWLAMLGHRNRTRHTYDEALAKEVYGHLAGYLPALHSLVQALRDTGEEPDDAR